MANTRLRGAQSQGPSGVASVVRVKTPPGKRSAKRPRPPARATPPVAPPVAPPAPAAAPAPTAAPAPAPTTQVTEVTPPKLSMGRIPVLGVRPSVDDGRWPGKAVVGEEIPVTATVFAEGHGAVNATAVLTSPSGQRFSSGMRSLGPGLDRWGGSVTPDAMGEWTLSVEGWSDPYATWEHDATVKVAADVDTELMLAEGAVLLRRAVAQVERTPAQARPLLDAVTALEDPGRPAPVRLAAGLSAQVQSELTERPLRDQVTASDPLPLRVERERALYGSWYEFFPRSEGARQDASGTWRSGTFRTAMDRLPAVAAMGFDILYLPPIHPIGRVNRKGPNNTLNPGPQDPGSPWAIGSSEGGHDTIHPDLGTFADFAAFVERAGELGLEVALDLALQCAPDHPWATSHPEWFTTRVDGSIAYAENPPKKYQDIYPVNFDNDPEGLYDEVLRIVRLWMSYGIKTFRVDNPHTKPVAFWERLIGQISAEQPEAIFLAEAFTRPAMMNTLGKVGFQQSYTYFTWRNAKWEIEEYLTELSGEAAAWFRPNFFVNTPDILTEFLQYGGPTAFRLRAALAATLAPTWGVYTGYELYEHVARPGAEEYIDNEKFQYRPRDWAAYEEGGARAGQSLAPYITQLNQIRRDHPALHRLRNLTFHTADDPATIVYSKRRVVDGRDDTIVVVINLDPHSTRETWIHLDLQALGLRWDEGFLAHDLVTGASWHWGEHAFVRLGRDGEPAHILQVRSL
jgi:starch synthase (maltosyl-transferring)